MSEIGKAVLSTLLIVGAQSPEKAEPTSRLATRLGIDVGMLEGEINGLRGKGYVATTLIEGKMAAYLTPTGIVTASSTYS
jgi:hypothetical protein